MSLAKKPRVRRGGVIFLLLAGVMFCCLGVLLSMPATTAPEKPSALGGANGDVGHVDRGETKAAAPVPSRSYPLLPPAEEVQETDKRPVNASVLTMLVLVIASLGAASVLWVLTTNARRRAAVCCSWGLDQASFSTALEGPSFLGVFLL